MKGTHFTELPEKAGRYRVIWNTWHTFLPVFMDFDGTEWVELAYKRMHYFVLEDPKDRDSTRLPGEFIWFPNE